MFLTSDAELKICLLVDCSNSIADNDLISLSKKLCINILKHVSRVSCVFNVILFGTDYAELFPFYCTNSPANLRKAHEFLHENLTHAKKRGNTDLLNAIRSLLMLDDDTNQNCILVSDGHFTRSNELFQSLAHAHSNTGRFKRIFTCSIGNTSNNNHYLKLVANLTGKNILGSKKDKSCTKKY